MKPSPAHGEHTSWEALVDVEGTSDWRAGVRKVIEYFQERTEGSVIEERRCTLTFDYTHALDREAAAHQASELADQINGARGSEAIRVVRDATAVSVGSLHAFKAAAASILMERMGDADFIFVVGGARADESLFRWANRLSRGVNGHANGSNGANGANGNGASNGDAVRKRAVTTLTAGTHATEASAVLPAGVSLIDVVRLLTFPHLVGLASAAEQSL